VQPPAGVGPFTGGRLRRLLVRKRLTLAVIPITIALLAAGTVATVVEGAKQSLYFPETMLQEIKDEAGATVSRSAKAAGTELEIGKWTMAGERALADGHTLLMTRSGSRAAPDGTRTTYEIRNTVEPAKGKKPTEMLLVASKVKENGSPAGDVLLSLSVDPGPGPDALEFSLALTVDGGVTEGSGTADSIGQVRRDPVVSGAMRTLELEWGIPEPDIGLRLPVVLPCCGTEDGP
jgi:hypothetical protein